MSSLLGHVPHSSFCNYISHIPHHMFTCTVIKNVNPPSQIKAAMSLYISHLTNKILVKGKSDWIIFSFGGSPPIIEYDIYVILGEQL